jgi:radical SAM superfamily enzyme with C-terminal helix-hairpin-helix motif
MEVPMHTYRCSITPEIRAPTPEEAARVAQAAVRENTEGFVWTVEARDPGALPDDQLADTLRAAYEAVRRLVTPGFLREHMGLHHVSPGELCDALVEAKKRLRSQAEARTIDARDLDG